MEFLLKHGKAVSNMIDTRDITCPGRLSDIGIAVHTDSGTTQRTGSKSYEYLWCHWMQF